MIRCCKDCDERHIGCHGECEKYRAESQIHRAEKARIDSIRWGRNEANEVLKKWRIPSVEKKKNLNVRGIVKLRRLWSFIQGCHFSALRDNIFSAVI